MIDMIRSIITSVAEGVIKRFSGSGRPNETFTNREYFQHYGYTSRPLPEAEGIILKKGNNIIMIASDDRRYRIELESGEVAIYTDEGDFIHFKRGKLLHVNTGSKLLIDATNDVEINTKQVKVNASGSAELASPAITLSGNVTITGSLNVSGNINSDGSIIDASGNTNHHSH